MGYVFGVGKAWESWPGCLRGLGWVKRVWEVCLGGLGVLAGAPDCVVASSWRRGLPAGRRPDKDARLPGLLIGSDRHDKIYSCVKVICSVYHAVPCNP